MSFIDKLKENQKKNEEAGRNDFNVVKQKLLSGGYGLTKTFWLWWFIPAVLLSVMEYVSESTGTVLRIDTGMLVWSGLMFVCVMRTTANKLWKALALLVTGLDSLLSLAGVATFFL
ncbi:hypothetical protein [Edaphovirga cremea]|uniref:hypothetical protein n=1 Tax=Edaphovirga cremea TaxID=2267246 RepID=UPI000DF01A01|nr:hypothetical protein [Edaphovirga cremea]